MKSRNWTVTLLATVLLVSCVTPSVIAGGGPENVLVVVNSNSEDSKAIAKHYVSLRQIPTCNVLNIDWNGKTEAAPIQDFREKLLGPILAAIEERGLTAQIDCIAYSSDFPWLIHADYDSKRTWTKAPRPKFLSGQCSITALTFLHEAVMAEDAKAYLNLGSNRYSFPSMIDRVQLPSYGFRSSTRFRLQEKKTDDNGVGYLLSVMLGVTSGRGNSVEEVKTYLTRAAKADGTTPKGTIYFCKNPDIRSRTRQPMFAAAINQLTKAGVQAEIVTRPIPANRPDVQGLMAGIARVDWEKSGSTILPGAICEHLTSYGGRMSRNAGQTPLSEFLRHGAAGASGTVGEPYAIAAKFPSPSMHVHYARGCTLAESFYQSVSGPFQLLIVGDPLCRPWANIPVVTVEGINKNQKVKGTVSISASAKLPGNGSLSHFELFVDGVRHQKVPPGKPMILDTTALQNGPHELRVVAIEASRIQSQGRNTVTVVVDN